MLCSLKDLKPQTSSSRLLAASSSSALQRESNGWDEAGSGGASQTPRMEAHGREAGLTADEHGSGMHLLTPSGIAAELRSVLWQQHVLHIVVCSHTSANPRIALTLGHSIQYLRAESIP